MKPARNQPSTERGRLELISNLAREAVERQHFLEDHVLGYNVADLEEVSFNHGDDYQLLKKKDSDEIFLKIGDFIIRPDEIIGYAEDILDDMPPSVRDDLVERGLIPREHFEIRARNREKELLATKKRKHVAELLGQNKRVRQAKG